MDEVNKERLFLIIFFSLIAIFAFYMEDAKGKNAYTVNLPNKKDTKQQILNKIRNTFYTDYKTVKWRRSYLVSFLVTFSFFGFVLNRMPEPREIVLCLLVSFFIYYISWSMYSDVVLTRNKLIFDNNISQLKL